MWCLENGDVIMLIRISQLCAELFHLLMRQLMLLRTGTLIS